ncbi:MAG TPA: ribonuclease H family protein [Myxococcota bacterium]|nr:ribonuclease H family protein [Myxococcota bacterium]HQK51104.1 ribonuclease H family protein [Myxococcota bacterium]
MGRRHSPKVYAWKVGDEAGLAGTWAECRARVQGQSGARYRGFATVDEARAWLDQGAPYEPRQQRREVLRQDLPEDALYFDAGTGRGTGTEANVTDRAGTPLAHLVAPERVLTPFGTIRLSPGRTNNYGELMACYYALKAARHLGVKRVMGDSRLVLDFWSRGHLSAAARQADPDLARLADMTARERALFEASGGRLDHVPGDRNPADLGFHRD